METFITKVGDYGKPIEVYLQDANGNVDITNYVSVKFSMTPRGKDSPKTVDAQTCTVVDATTGRVKYTFQSANSELSTGGEYDGEFVYTNAAGKEISFPSAAGRSAFQPITIIKGKND
jgi:hypothetical protein